MAANQITLEGWKEFEAKCLDMTKIFPDEIDEAAMFAAQTWEGGAKRDAPKDFGQLAGGISSVKVAAGDWEVVSSKLSSPFMEWGSKLRAVVPGDLIDYASQFQHEGFSAPTENGVKALIYAWAKRKGIPEAAWWPIYKTIMSIGVTPHPFFFKQKPIAERQLLSDLEQMINTPR